MVKGEDVPRSLVGGSVGAAGGATAVAAAASPAVAEAGGRWSGRRRISRRSSRSRWPSRSTSRRDTALHLPLSLATRMTGAATAGCGGQAAIVEDSHRPCRCGEQGVRLDASTNTLNTE